jgi:hypothetical protein
VTSRTVRFVARALLGLATLAGSVRADDVPAGSSIDFERHVASLLGRLGCNAGPCHGSFQGRGGLRLSLFGQDPGQDYLALTRDGLGRRVNRIDPEESLLLLKPAGLVPHGGGQRFAPDSWEYDLLRTWIERGASRQPGQGRVESLRVEPQDYLCSGPGESVASRVLVRFADGTEADMTRFCEFRARDDTIVEVAPDGVARGLRPGDSAIVVTYRGQIASTRVLIPRPEGADLASWDHPGGNLVDREVLAKLRKLRISPSELASDAEFLRRVTLDTIGTLPGPDEVRAFLADPTSPPVKWARKVEELLAHPLHAALWATRLCDLTGCDLDVMEGPPELRPKRAKMWHDWFRKRIADNMPYDQIVRGVLRATSREGQDAKTWVQQEAARLQKAKSEFESDYAERPGLDLFWRRVAGEDFFPIEQMAERTASAFLGVRIECAQCHRHPSDRWSQGDYRSFANLFAKVQFGGSPEVVAATVNLLDERRRAPADQASPPIPRLREVYLGDQPRRRFTDPATHRPLPARILGGPEVSREGEAREALFDWLVRPDNPFFARSLVNRVWAEYFGGGLVDPVDDLSAANPPTNPQLLDALAADFVEHGYDLRRLERTILLSRTYQRSSTPNETNAEDRTNASHAQPRPLRAEVVVDVLHAALGTSGDCGPDVPKGARAIEVAPNRITQAEVARAFRVFGRPARNLTCACEPPREPALAQTLYLMTDRSVLDQLARGRIRGLLDSGRPDTEIIEEVFLSTFSRFPNTDEARAAREHIQGRPDRLAAYADILWALINSREFLLNH